MKYLYLLVILSFLAINGYAQNPETGLTEEDEQKSFMGLKDGWYIGGTVGYNLFYGDITTYSSLPAVKDFSKSFASGLSLFGGKRLTKGLSVEAYFESGNIKGTKTSVSRPVYFKGQVIDASLMARYNITDFLFRKYSDRYIGKHGRRAQAYLLLGAGQVFFRSRSNFVSNNNLYDSYGYTTTDPSWKVGNATLTKSGMKNALTIVGGARFSYKLNYKTDVVVDLHYVSAFDDRLDAWTRSWSKNDRYLYTGVGFCYNFGRNVDTDEVPKPLRAKTSKERAAERAAKFTAAIAGDDDDNVVSSPEPANGKRALINFGGNNSRPSTATSDDLNLRLKLFETQLKLFEMQYLMEVPKKQ